MNPAGATLVYAALYLGCLAVLADVHLLDLAKRLLVREPKTDDEKFAADQASLAKQSKELSKQAKLLEQKAAAETAAKAKVAKAPNTLSSRLKKKPSAEGSPNRLWALSRYCDTADQRLVSDWALSEAT